MSNSILKNFNPEYDVEKSNNFLFVNLTVSKNEIRSKNVNYVKVCVVRTENLSKPSFNLPGYANSYENMIYRNNVNLIKQFDFEDQPISLDLEDSSYQEITNIIPIQSVLNNIVNQNRSIPELIGKEYDHTFKIYFLDDKKRIVEKKEFKQIEGYRLENYDPVDFDDVIENTLQSSVDILFNDYNEDFTSGPIVVYDDILNDIENFSLSEVSIVLDFNGKSYNFLNASLLSILMIIAYKSGIVFDLYEYLKVNLDDEVSIQAFFNYKGLSIKKDIVISRQKINSFYSTYFRRFKTRFVNDAFKNKITASLNETDTLTSLKLRLSKPDLKYFPISEDTLKISITRNVDASSTRISNIYTTESLSEDSKIIAASNFDFNFQALYDNIEVNQSQVFYIKCPNIFLRWVNLTVKFNNQIVYQSESLSSNDRQENNKITTESKEIDFFGRSVLRNKKISKSKIKSLIDYDKINKKSESLKKLGYNTDNNDYLPQNVIDNTIVKYTIKQQNRLGEIIEETRYDRMSNVISGDELSIDSNKAKRKSNTTVSLETITLPPSILNKMVSVDESTDDDKETVANYLNNAMPGSYRKINDLINKNLFVNSANKPEREIFQSIFDIQDKDPVFEISEEENQVDEIDESDNENQIIISESVALGDLLNLSQFSDEDSVFFENFLFYAPQQNYLKVFKKKSDSIVATVDMTKILEEIDYRSTDSISFNVEKLITLEFDRENFKQSEELDRFVYDNNKLIVDGSYFIFKNITSFLKDKTLYIKNNLLEEVIEITEDVYNSFYKIWGQNDTLYITNILARYVITIFINDRVKRIMQINNYIEKDYSLLESMEQKTYILNSNLHMPNIKVVFKRPRGDN